MVKYITMIDFRVLLEKEVKNAISNLYSISIEFEFSPPKNPSHGQLSANVGFQISKVLNESKNSITPQKVCEEIQIFLKEHSDLLGKFESFNGFLNYHYSNDDYLYISNYLRHESQGGFSDLKKINQDNHFSIEAISPNSTKSLHVGHLLNAAIGISISNILEFTGGKVRREILFNDRGVGVEKLVYAYEQYLAKNSELINFLETENATSQPLLDNLYLWGSNSYTNSDQLKIEINKRVVQWESEMTDYNLKKEMGRMLVLKIILS
jgi:arginyl-tRNA synthetase